MSPLIELLDCCLSSIYRRRNNSNKNIFYKLFVASDNGIRLLFLQEMPLPLHFWIYIFSKFNRQTLLVGTARYSCVRSR